MPVNKLSIQDFAAKIKAKYPDYKEINDTLLTQKIISKYPEYKDMVNYQVQSEPTVTKPENEINHTSIHDIRHLDEMANREVPQEQQTVIDPESGIPTENKAFQAENKQYGEQLGKSLQDLGGKLGIDPAKLKSTISDFPEEHDESRIQNRAQLKDENPETYERLRTADQNKNLIADKSIHDANEYNQLQGSEAEPIQNLEHLSKNINRQREIIYSNLSGSERGQALANLERNRSAAFNATNPEIQNEYANNEDAKAQMNVMQYAGLKHLQAFDPQKYQLYSTLLKPRDNTNDDTVDQKVGLEKARKDLLDIGRRNTEKYINEKQYDLDKSYKNAQTQEEKDQIASEFLKNKSIVDSINQDEEKDATRFPYLKDLEFERQAVELAGNPDKGVLNYTLSKFGKGIGNTGKSIENAETNLLGTYEDIANLNLQRLGEYAKDENQFYLPEGSKSEASPMVYKFDKGLQDDATKIKNDKSLSDDQRKQQLVDLVKNNQDQVHTISNTANFGKSANFFSKATLYKNAGMIGDIASIAVQTAGGNEIGLSKFVANALPMYLTTQNDFYKQALEEGRSNPMEYANTHAAIMMAAGMVNPDLNIVKRAFGQNTQLGKTIAGISEGTWNDIVSANKPIINKIKNSLTGAAKEAATIGLTYGAGTSIAKDLADKGLFGKNLSGEDILNNAVKATKDATIGSIALLGLHAITNFKTVSPEEKARVWEIGDNPKLANEQLDDSVKKGAISQAVADQRKQIIKNVSKLIQSVPTEDAKGNPLTDQQRAKYLYNLVLKNKIDDIKGDLPEAQKEKLDAIKRGIDIDNNAILDPKTEKENLIQRKRELTDELIVGEDGKSNLTPLEKKTREDELEEINKKLEEKKSSISVIQPEEIKRPETVTIKPKQETIGFKTEKGSIYEIYDDQSTIRNKMARQEHPGEEGIQPKSKKTYYVTKEDLDKLDLVQTQGWKEGEHPTIAELPDGKIGVGILGGEKHGKVVPKTIIEPKKTAEIGLYPVEVWEGVTQPHFGNKITELITNKYKENAIQQPETGTVLQRTPESTGSKGGERGGMESSQQGNETTGIGTQKENKSQNEEDWPFVEEPGDNEVTSIKNAVTEQKIKEYGLTPALKEAKRALPEVWNEAVKKVNKGYDPQFLVDQLKKKPRPITDTEDALLLYHQATKEAELDSINKSINESYEKGTREDFEELSQRKAKILDDLQDLYDVDKKVGTANARGLNARKMMVDRRFSLTNMMAEKRASQEGKPLTSEEQAEVEKKYRDLKEANVAIEKRVSELEAENAALKNKATAEPEEVKEPKEKKPRKDYKSERKKIIKDIRDDLLKAAKGAGGLTSSIPLAAQLKAVAPHIPKLVRNLVESGIDKLEDVTKEVMDMLRPVIPEIEENHVHDLIAGEFKEAVKQKKQPTKTAVIKQQAKNMRFAVTDPKLLKLRADYERKKASWGDHLRKAELGKRTGLEKGQDTFVKWQRAFKLSGITTLAKLMMAGTTRLVSTPVEEVVGAGISKVLPKGITSKATGEAGLNVKAEAKAISQAFTQGLKDSYDILRKKTRGQSDIEAVFGKGNELPPEAIGFFGQLHSAIKAPVKRAAFERSFRKRIEANINNGVDVSDPMVQTKIAIQAYKDGQRAIFMQDNIVTDAYKRAINSLEKNKTSPVVGKAFATGLQWLIPFVKVPTNIIGEVQRHATGVFEGAARLGYQAMKNGLKDVSEEEADAILRAFKKGSIGAGALLIGYFNADHFGGYYQKGEKQTSDKLKPGSAKILGMKIPVWLLESPLFQTMQLGATVRKLSDAKMTNKPKGLTEAMIASELDLMGHEPLVEQPSRISSLFTNPKEREYFLGELAKGTVIPSALSNIAQYTDPEDSRKPSSILEHVETGIPGLRKNVPTKTPSKVKGEHHRNTGKN